MGRKCFSQNKSENGKTLNNKEIQTFSVVNLQL